LLETLSSTQGLSCFYHGESYHEFKLLELLWNRFSNISLSQRSKKYLIKNLPQAVEQHEIVLTSNSHNRTSQASSNHWNQEHSVENHSGIVRARPSKIKLHNTHLHQYNTQKKRNWDGTKPRVECSQSQSHSFTVAHSLDRVLTVAGSRLLHHGRVLTVAHVLTHSSHDRMLSCVLNTVLKLALEKSFHARTAQWLCWKLQKVFTIFSTHPEQFSNKLKIIYLRRLNLHNFIIYLNLISK